MDRAKQWLYKFKNINWVSQDHVFRFPSGATLQFGYIDNPDDRFRYASSEYQFIGFDELTEFRLTEDDNNPYLFMFSRLRKTMDNPVPLRVRSASNPGNVGHQWVKSRFVTDEAISAIRDDQPQVFYADPINRERAFVPALIKDNPAINEAEYAKNLMHLPPVTRQRLLAGDWSIVADALIKVEWLRYYMMRGEILHLLKPDGTTLALFDVRDCQHFATIDTAGTSEQKAKEKKGKPPSWSVAAVWCRPPSRIGTKILILRDVWRKRVEFPDLLAGIRGVQAKWRLPRLKIENAHCGPQVWSVLRGEMPIDLISHEGKGKVERNAPFLNMLSRGEVYLPRFDNDWRPTLEAEWLVWTGLDEETADQIDVGGYAAREVQQVGGAWGGVIRN
jgi:phage terminase large subunit-like protein